MGDEVLVLVPLLIVMGEGGKHLKKVGVIKCRLTSTVCA